MKNEEDIVMRYGQALESDAQPYFQSGMVFTCGISAKTSSMAQKVFSTWTTIIKQKSVKLLPGHQ